MFKLSQERVHPSSTSRVERVPQEQPTLQLDKTGKENEPKATEYTSPTGRKGEQEAEDTDIGLKERPQARSTSEGIQTVTLHYSQ